MPRKAKRYFCGFAFSKNVQKFVDISKNLLKTMLFITIFKVFNFEKFKKILNIKIAIHFCLCYTLVSKGANIGKNELEREIR